MSTQIGSGGVIYNLYKNYGDLSKNIRINVRNFYIDSDRYIAENVYKWNSPNGYQSAANSEGILESIVFKFQKPFIFRAYRMQIPPDFRFQKSWKVETQYRNGDIKKVHSSNDMICTQMRTNPSYDCAVYSEKLFNFDDDKIHICDTINITATDADTFGTYSLTVGAIEFYEKHILQYTNLYMNLCHSFHFVFLLNLI